jgi:hypothetical protein
MPELSTAMPLIVLRDGVDPWKVAAQDAKRNASVLAANLQRRTKELSEVKSQLEEALKHVDGLTMKLHLAKRPVPALVTAVEELLWHVLNGERCDETDPVVTSARAALAAAKGGA